MGFIKFFVVSPPPSLSHSSLPLFSVLLSIFLLVFLLVWVLEFVRDSWLRSRPPPRGIERRKLLFWHLKL